LKIAHLILCHAYPEQLRRLIMRLTHEDAFFYIHVDKKTEITPFLPLGKLPNVYFIANRVKVIWAGYSQVQAMLNSFKEMLAANTQYDYINILSGQDYPLKSTRQIHRFFADNPGKAFMETLVISDEWQEAIPRLTKYHFTDSVFPGKYVAEWLLNAVLPMRKLPGDLIPVGRSSWLTIAPAAAKYIVDFLQENPALVRFFKFTWGVDELIFQTILYNSSFKKDIVYDNLRYVDWSEGNANPKVLTMPDAEALKNSGKLFARKFSMEKDNKILDYLDSMASAK